MRAMIMAAAAAALLAATPALALTPQAGPSQASLAGAQFLNDSPSLPVLGEGSAGLQAIMVGSGLRADGLAEFSGDGASSYGYLLSAESADTAKKPAEPYFADDLVTRRTPGVTTHYAPAPAAPAAAAPQAK